MDQVKIGQFIAQLRKEKKLTQRQLADKFLISDKTVSKWECGKGLPEVSLMLPLCEELGISVNELLSGEKIPEKDYREKAEENIMELVREREENKKKLVIEAVVACMGVLTLVLCVMLAGLLEEVTTPLRIFLIVFGSVIVAASIGIVVAIDVDTGTFECRSCGERFVPSTKEYIFTTHGLTTRKLKCPHCGKTTNCKKRLTR